jgi:hypothetical protein
MENGEKMNLIQIKEYLEYYEKNGIDSETAIELIRIKITQKRIR